MTPLSERLLSVTRALGERLEAALEPQGLSLPKLEVLQKLVASGEPLPLGVLTERLGCAKSNVTQLMDRLEADGLVRRTADPRDRRSVLAELTAEGRRRCTAGLEAVAVAEAEFLGRLPASAREQLEGALQQFGPQGGG